MPEGATNRTLDALAQHGVTWSTIPYEAMHKNGGGIHCCDYTPAAGQGLKLLVRPPSD